MVKNNSNDDHPMSETSGAATGPFEPFVDASRAAAFYGVSRKQLLRLSRLRRIPAHPLDSVGNGTRTTWRYRLSELDAHLQNQRRGSEPPPRGDKMHCGSPREGGQ